MCLVSSLSLGVAHLITSPFPATQFPGCAFRCAVCLFWGADLWLQPSQWMLTIQNPKKSWLAMKPACSLVDNHLWGHNCPLLALAALACLSPEGNGLTCSRLALLSPLFCEWVF